MKKHYKPKTKNVTKLKTYLDKKTKNNELLITPKKK